MSRRAALCIGLWCCVAGCLSSEDAAWPGFDGGLVSDAGGRAGRGAVDVPVAPIMPSRSVGGTSTLRLSHVASALGPSANDLARAIDVPADSLRSTAPRAEQTPRVLFIGNRLTSRNDLPGLVHSLDPRIEVDIVAGKERSLVDHRDAGLAARKITTDHYTHVVLQERTFVPLETPERFHDAGDELARLALRSGATPIFLEPWSHRDACDCMYQGDDAAWSGGSPKAMQALLHDAIAHMADETGSQTVFAGDAWQVVMDEHPDVALFGPDGNLPSLAGSYLTACIVLRAITGVPASDDTPVPAGLDARTAALLREAAARTVRRSTADRMPPSVVHRAGKRARWASVRAKRALTHRP